MWGNVRRARRRSRRLRQRDVLHPRRDFRHLREQHPTVTEALLASACQRGADGQRTPPGSPLHPGAAASLAAPKRTRPNLRLRPSAASPRSRSRRNSSPNSPAAPEPPSTASYAKRKNPALSSSAGDESAFWTVNNSHSAPAEPPPSARAALGRSHRLSPLASLTLTEVFAIVGAGTAVFADPARAWHTEARRRRAHTRRPKPCRPRPIPARLSPSSPTTHQQKRLAVTG